MNKTLRRQLAIATSVQLVDGQQKHAAEPQHQNALRATDRATDQPPPAPHGSNRAKRTPLRHAGLNE